MADDDLFRDSYILTMTQSNKHLVEPSVEDLDSFDVTQMADAAFESFAEVFLSLHYLKVSHKSLNF